LISSELKNITLESSCAADVCLQLPLTTISSIGSEKTSVLKKEISVEIKKTNVLFLMMLMQFLRHYCMDQVQRVPNAVSGQLPPLCNYLHHIESMKKNLWQKLLMIKFLKKLASHIYLNI